jgi:hypothetical protein
MENYIVRIYRRDETDPDKMAGTFESVENETRNAFTSLGSLIDLLTPKRGTRTGLGTSDKNEFTQVTEPATLAD